MFLLLSNVITSIILFVFILLLCINMFKTRKDNISINNKKNYIFYTIMLGLFLFLLLENIIKYVNNGQVDIEELLRIGLLTQMCIINIITVKPWYIES